MSLYNTEIKTHALNYDTLNNYSEINNLIKQNLETNTLPFNHNLPLPLDTNVITGNHFSDINKQKIELKVASIGSKRNLWIFGADAQYLGLELKSTIPSEYKAAKKINKNFNCEPVIVQANVRERLFTGKANKTNIVSEGLGADCQCAYMLDQFTDSSIQKVFSLATLNRKLSQDFSPVKERSALIAKEIIKNINEYNSGEKDKELRNKKKRNISINSHKNSLVNSSVKENLNNITKNYSSEQKTVFNFYHKHFIEQLSGQKIYYISPEKKEELNNAFTKLLEQAETKEKKTAITQTIFDAYTFTERLSHHNFSLEPVYSAEEEKAKQIQLKKIQTPKAARDNTLQTATILDDHTKQKLKTRSYGMKINQEQQGW